MSSFLSHIRNILCIYYSTHQTNFPFHFLTARLLITLEVYAAPTWRSALTHRQQQQQPINTSVCFFAPFILRRFPALIQAPAVTKYIRTQRHSVVGCAAKYTLFHSSRVIFLMASMHLYLRVSAGQILPLALLASVALLPVASGHSQACRKKSTPHHWRQADTDPSPPPSALK